MIAAEDMKKTLEEIVPRIAWGEEQGLMESGRLDSLDILMIVARLHARFQVQIPSGELTAENFDSLETITALYRRCEGSSQVSSPKRLA